MRISGYINGRPYFLVSGERVWADARARLQGWSFEPDYMTPEWLAEWQSENDQSRWPDRGERNDEAREAD